ncbi:MAG: bifunctional glutamate N-acetyltransferase/amino-acid acetyltransferase ArgJ [Ilumatobacteraceae bacterium]
MTTDRPQGERLPAGFTATVANIGIKDSTDDIVVIAAEGGCASAGVFTRSRFAGPSVTVSRENLRGGRSDAMVVISKNANVANGPDGLADAREVLDLTGALIGASPDRILLASTGVIGRRYPMERVRAGFAGLEPPSATTGLEECARAIMTTDTVPKTARAEVPTPDGDTVTVAGIAKGVGMIEPDMATMIAVILTDAEVDPEALQALFASVVDETFNCVSVDSDTSTSDTAVVLASGARGPVDHADLRDALLTVCTSLTRQIAADGEGAETLIEVLVDGARDVEQARRVAKSIVNSPLVKTAVHGADPNWGRVAMAVGKCSDDTDIDPDQVVIRFGVDEVYPRQVDDSGLAALSDYLRGDEVLIHVSLGAGSASSTVWGCDLTDGYVRINADYTT